MRASVRVAATVLIVITVVLWAIPGQPVVAQPKKVRVGLVYDVGGRGDKSFNDMAYDGLARAQKEFTATLQTRDLEPTAGGENREELLRLLAGEKYDLILGIGFLFTDSITRVAKDNPRVKFAIVDGFIDKEPNVVSLLFQENEGSFQIGRAHV